MLKMLDDLKSEIKVAAQTAMQEMLDELGTDNVIEKLNYLPVQIMDQEAKLLTKRRAIEEAKGNLELAKQIVVAEVSEERNSNDKPKYSNETARSAEVAKRLAVDQDYLEIKKSYQVAEDDLSAAQFELNRLNNEFGAYKIVGQMLAAKMQLLAGL